MNKVKIAVFVFVLLANASPSDVQETRREEKRAVPPKEVPRTEQREKPTTKTPKASASFWQTLSDRQIARMFFPEERLYFQPDFEGINEDLTTIGWGVVVHKVKRVVANLDGDPEEEMAIQIVYGTGWCTSCGGQVIIAILDKQNGKVRVAWRTEEYGVWERDSTTNISTVKLITKDKFLQLGLVVNTSPLGFQPHKEMRIIRWDGKKFTTIWSHDLESFSGGERSDVPHEYLAKVDFLDDNKGAKRIKVASVVRPTLLYIWQFWSRFAPPMRSIRRLWDFGCDPPGIV